MSAALPSKRIAWGEIYSVPPKRIAWGEIYSLPPKRIAWGEIYSYPLQADWRRFNGSLPHPSSAHRICRET